MAERTRLDRAWPTVLRRVAGLAAGLAVLTAPALFPASAGQYAGSTSDEGNAVTAAEVAPPTDLVAAQSCSPRPGIAYRGPPSGRRRCCSRRTRRPCGG